MALVDCGRIYYPDPQRLPAQTGNSTNAALQINGSGYRLGLVFAIPASGTITEVGVRVAACASAVTSRLGLYTVDSSGNPTTTLYGGSNYGTFTPSANTYSSVTLGTSATATRGDVVALVVEFDSTAGDMFLSGSNGTYATNGLPYQAKNPGTGSWSKTNSYIWFAHIYYSDGGGMWPDFGATPFTGVIATGTFNSGSTPDEYAIRITVPFKCRVAGIWTMFTSAGGGASDAVLYSGTTALRTVSVDGDIMGQGAASTRPLYFASGQELNAGDTVRAAIKPTSATNWTYRNAPLVAAGSEQGLGVPQGTCQSTRTDAGSWSDATTTFPLSGLIIDQLDDGASAGGGTSGGFIARGPSSIIQMIE